MLLLSNINFNNSLSYYSYKQTLNIVIPKLAHENVIETIFISMRILFFILHVEVNLPLLFKQIILKLATHAHLRTTILCH